MDHQAALASFVLPACARGSEQTLARYERGLRLPCSSNWVTNLCSRPLDDMRRALARLHADGCRPHAGGHAFPAWRTWFRHLAKVGEADPAVSSGIKAPRAQSGCQTR